MPSESDSKPLVGRSLGRYQLLRVLGRGAMGMVYEGLDTRLGRTVAIKTVLRSFLADDSTAADYAVRFEREAQAAARLNHPNIVALFDFGEQEDVSYIVMEFIRGRELAEAFKAGERFTPQQTQRLMTELLDALGAAHDSGIVHRDVKPANVLIDESGRVKLADFGVARVVEPNQDRTLPGTMVGTPSAMAPEQILGQAVGSRTDIFSAGLIFYQLLTGKRPFAGSGPFGVQRAIVHDEPVPPTALNPELPKAVDAVVAKALAKAPDQRFNSAAAFSAAVAAALGPVVPGRLTVPGSSQDVLDPDSTVLLPKPPLSTPALPGQDVVRTPVQVDVVLPAEASPGSPPQILLGGTGVSGNAAVTSVQAVTVPLGSGLAAGSAAPPAASALPVGNLHEASYRAAAPRAAHLPAPPGRARWPVVAIALAMAVGVAFWWSQSRSTATAVVVQTAPAVEPVATPAVAPVATSAMTPAAPSAAPFTPPPGAGPSGGYAANTPVAPTPISAGDHGTPSAAVQAPDMAVLRPSPAQAAKPAAPIPAAEVAKSSYTSPSRSVEAKQSSDDPRCVELRARIQLGDTLTPEQTTLFHTRCAR